MPPGKSRYVRPAAGEIVELNLGGRRMPGMEEGSHVLHVISSISGLNPVCRIRHNEYARCQITRIQFRPGHTLLNSMHHLAGSIFQIT